MTGPEKRDDIHVSYAKTNLLDVEDSAAKNGVGEVQEARFPRVDLGAEQVGMNYLIVKPDQREAFAHRHHQAEELYVVLSGAGRVKLDDDVIELAPLDAIRVAPGTTRQIEAGPEGIALLIFGARFEGDGELVQDFWT